MNINFQWKKQNSDARDNENIYSCQPNKLWKEFSHFQVEHLFDLPVRLWQQIKISVPVCRRSLFISACVKSLLQMERKKKAETSLFYMLIAGGKGNILIAGYSQSWQKRLESDVFFSESRNVPFNRLLWSVPSMFVTCIQRGLGKMLRNTWQESKNICILCLYVTALTNRGCMGFLIIFWAIYCLQFNV